MSLNPSSETPDDEYSGWTSYLLNPDPQDEQEGIIDETDKFEADYLRDLSITTQINAVSPAPDTDNLDSDNLTGRDDEQESALADDSPESLLDSLPSLTPTDFSNDVDFKDIYLFVLNGTFDGDEKTYRRLLLTREQYFFRDGLLYKLALPRKSKLQRAYPVSERLCIPTKYRGQILKLFHDKLGHYSVQRLFLTLYSIAFWPNMYQDIGSYCKTCDVCLRTKRNFSFRTLL